MRFNLIDRIEDVSENRLVAVKYVSLAEEYLGDHFPSFPVLPGVLMLEALVQGAGWLLHRRSNFAKSMAVLKEAKNVKYGTFVAPGNALRVEIDAVKFEDQGGTFKASGTVNGQVAVSARLEMSYFNVGSFRSEDDGRVDRQLTDHNQFRWAVLTQSALTQSGNAIAK
jgi:3-hydroxyacyl-[acyl-carrier-protein] dehydratase